MAYRDSRGGDCCRDSHVHEKPDLEEHMQNIDWTTALVAVAITIVIKIVIKK